MKMKQPLICLTVMIALLFAGTALADDDAVKKHPGYVDLELMKIFGDREAKIEVHLREPMLKLVSSFVELEDEEVSEILRKLLLVRVHVYDVDRDLAEKFSEFAKATGKELDAKGWERMVRVRENRGENVDIYVKPGGNYEWIDGLVVMVVEGGDEAIFVNIVGEIKPDDIQRLGDHFDIDELEDSYYDRDRRKKRN